MNKCGNCGKKTKNRRFCSKSCSAKVTNTEKPRRKKEYPFRFCKLCGKELVYRAGQHNKFCNQTHKLDYEYNTYIGDWLSGIKSIGKPGRGTVSAYVRRYLFEKNNNKCSQCGWGEINQYSKSIPLEVDHIDGNHTNDDPSNLRLVCPNCHSLSPTFGILNKGNGRRYFRQKYRDEVKAHPYPNG